MDHREPEIRAEHGAAAGQLHLALPRPLLSGHPGRPQDRAHNLLKIKFEWKIIKQVLITSVSSSDHSYLITIYICLFDFDPEL